MNLAIIQARLGSSRFPRKVLEKIGDKTVIELVYNRVRSASSVDEVVVATSKEISDNDLAVFCQSKGFPLIRGSEDNVLQRFMLAIETYQPVNVLRVTADCPLVDPNLIDSLWSIFSQRELQYCSISTGAGVARANVKRFPDGLDAEWVQSDVLRQISNEELSPLDSEHVTSYIWRNSSRYRTGLLEPNQDHTNMRITLDTYNDLEFLKELQLAIGERFEMADSSELIDVIERKLIPKQAKIVLETYNEFYGQERTQNGFS